METIDSTRPQEGLLQNCGGACLANDIIICHQHWFCSNFVIVMCRHDFCIIVKVLSEHCEKLEAKF